jgi:hypothetical protein
MPTTMRVPGTISTKGSDQTGRTSSPAPSTACCCANCVGSQCLDRTRYFAGQLLTDADHTNDQTYCLEKGGA